MTSRKQSADEAMQEMLFDVKVEGLRAAFTRAKKILEDDNAPATAHAAIISHMFRAGGLHGAATQEVERELHEMSGEELQAALARLKRDLLSKTDEEDDILS
jgi:hypothetical protein